ETPEVERKTALSSPKLTGRQMIFAVRESDRDTAFLRRHLTEDLMRDLDLFQYEPKGDEVVIERVADEDNWEEVKRMLVNSVGTSSLPVIRVQDSDHGGKRTLYLSHDHDGRDLHLEYAERTLAYAYQLWQHEVVLETIVNGKGTLLVYNDRGFSTKALR